MTYRKTAMKLWLDDERPEPLGWCRAYTASEAVELLSTEKVTEISLDHDLGDKGIPEQTGYTVLQWIEKEVFENCFVPPKIHIHTANSSARDKMLMAVWVIERQHRINQGIEFQ